MEEENDAQKQQAFKQGLREEGEERRGEEEEAFVFSKVGLLLLSIEW